ncbi:DUF1642 domain-containing protein [Lactiplantibacillus plantarum]|uniref:DUF1642 domain-containing protein n=1 Tax=Lactiplantibacillus plantarum TaxID=1590 RepID=UPI000C7F53D2|nr:DUF1642 domain-containing protein [Lactiplantibacillus plantarum]WAU29400.1 hypothetical protein OR568_00965 [Lactiplantibacillus plantarum]
MIKVYRKTATIKAEQFDGTKQSADQLGLFKYRGGWYLETLEGSMLVSNGYWIATGVNGEHWAIADDVFKKTYAELPVIPENVAYIIKQAKKGDYKLGWVFNATYLGLWRVSVGNWIRTHADVFARAWLDGYVVEEDE